MTRKKPREERVSEIVRAAIEEFLEHGYEGASMASIAARAGISKGGLYHHFGSKDEVLLLANQELSAPVAQLMEQARRASSAKEGLGGYIHGYLGHWTHRERELAFFFLSMSKVLDAAPLGAMYGQYAEEMLDFFEELYTRGIAAGEFVPHDARTRALALLAALDGVVGYLVMDPRLETGDVTSRFTALFVDALATKGAGG